MSSRLTYSVNGNVNSYTMILTVNTSEVMNNKTIQCEFEASGIRTSHNQSATVNLFIVSSECEIIVTLHDFRLLSAFKGSVSSTSRCLEKLKAVEIGLHESILFIIFLQVNHYCLTLFSPIISHI